MYLTLFKIAKIIIIAHILINVFFTIFRFYLAHRFGICSTCMVFSSESEVLVALADCNIAVINLGIIFFLYYYLKLLISILKFVLCTTILGFTIVLAFVLFQWSPKL